MAVYLHKRCSSNVRYQGYPRGGVGEILVFENIYLMSFGVSLPRGRELKNLVCLSYPASPCAISSFTAFGENFAFFRIVGDSSSLLINCEKVSERHTFA
jgi:hypothetical protein